MRNLTEAQKKVLINLAYRLMVADHRLRIEESELIAALENELGVGSRMSDDEVRAHPDLSLLTNRESRVCVMLKLYAIAYSDAEMHQAEIGRLRTYGHQFGFDDATLDRMDAWARSHLFLVREAEAISRG
jgi:uncharacterized tellurite resistance protein B-like protein